MSQNNVAGGGSGNSLALQRSDWNWSSSSRVRLEKYARSCRTLLVLALFALATLLVSPFPDAQTIA